VENGGLQIWKFMGECVLVSLLGHMGWVYGRIKRG
jgi:hypothetical protein